MNSGYNPMRYDCETSGCFNKVKRPKIEVFSDCFPGRINFGDVDAEVEINGHFLQLEWKPAKVEMATGQHIKFKRYTQQPGWAVIVVAGCAETMEIEAFRVYSAGQLYPWVGGDLAALKVVICRWVTKSRANPYAH